MTINPGNSLEIKANNGRIVLLHNDDSSGQRSIKSDGIYAVLSFKAKSGAVPGDIR
jgi:stalled ribosome rescue protein Dom34